ncbi:MAG: adenylyltransferase/cytidyltransferase family protein [Candidatus Thermoplasmatota archaeon]|nr:adenylyltransferase/cytidyltransferase family protein [Candidatus Thermoplasmatota archaeon]
MVRVMASGVFDLLHIGHLHYLREARDMGDELVVVVATDETVRQRKHSPVIPEDMRRELVASLKPVDMAVVGHSDDMLRVVEELKPNIVALGYDQEVKDLRRMLRQRGIDAEVRRCTRYKDYDLNGTRKIISRIEEKLEKNELYMGDRERVS